MSDNDDNRSVRRLAARLLNRNEDDGLDEVNLITAAADSSVRLPFILSVGLFGVAAILFVVSVMIWGANEAAGRHLGNGPLWIAIPLGSITISTLLYWRHFQYQIGLITRPRAARYAHASRASIDTLDKLFAYLQRETSPRAYYSTANGTKRYIDRRYFFGSLRVLLLSEDANVRVVCMPPGGLWFSKPIKIDGNPEDILKAINVKPKAGGRPKEFDYVAIALMLIERPEVRDIRPGERGAEARIMTLIRDVTDGHPTGMVVPEDTQLREFAKQILAAIEKNRMVGK